MKSVIRLENPNICSLHQAELSYAVICQNVDASNRATRICFEHTHHLDFSWQMTDDCTFPLFVLCVLFVAREFVDFVYFEWVYNEYFVCDLCWIIQEFGRKSDKYYTLRSCISHKMSGNMARPVNDTLDSIEFRFILCAVVQWT